MWFLGVDDDGFVYLVGLINLEDFNFWMIDISDEGVVKLLIL